MFHVFVVASLTIHMDSSVHTYIKISSIQLYIVGQPVYSSICVSRFCGIQCNNSYEFYHCYMSKFICNHPTQLELSLAWKQNHWIQTLSPKNDNTPFCMVMSLYSFVHSIATRLISLNSLTTVFLLVNENSHSTTQ